jgi:hypothetical protein
MATGSLGFETRFDIGEGRLESAQIWLLRQVADAGAGLDKAVAGIRLDETGSSPQQRRLARTVPPHKAYPIPGRDAEGCPSQ